MSALVLAGNLGSENLSNENLSIGNLSIGNLYFNGNLNCGSVNINIDLLAQSFNKWIDYIFIRKMIAAIYKKFRGSALDAPEVHVVEVLVLPLCFAFRALLDSNREYIPT